MLRGRDSFLTFGLRRVAGRELSAAGERFRQILLELAAGFLAD